MPLKRRKSTQPTKMLKKADIKVNQTKEYCLDVKGERSSENKSCDEPKATENNQMSSNPQNCEQGNPIKEFHNANDVADSYSSKQNREKNSSGANIPQQNRNSDSDSDSDAESRKQILLSAEKRINRKVSTSESDCRNKRVCDKGETSSESDSAPEDVSFEVGRKMVVEGDKKRVDSIQLAKLKRKQQRKKKLETYKKQKEEKLLRLKQEQKKVDRISSSSSTESTHNDTTLKNRPTNSSEVSKKIYFSSDSDNVEKKLHEQKLNTTTGRNLKRLPADILNNLQDPVPQQKKKKKQIESVENYDRKQDRKGWSKGKNTELQWDTDYIPLDSSTVTQFGVVPLDKPRKKTIGEEAAAFRQNLLYGDQVKRAPATLNSIRQQKLKVCGMDCLVTRPS